MVKKSVSSQSSYIPTLKVWETLSDKHSLSYLSYSSFCFGGQNRIVGAVKSVNNGRPGAEQTEVEGTVEGDIQSIRKASSVLFIFLKEEESQLQFCVLY